MGVRTERVNMLTFGLGSGLAGLAGTFLSQIGNVGPSMGQNYIVDCFMTVVVGGVGNLPGTVISAFGIGLADQTLQQVLLDPVIGKIVVLLCIILFLQWRPAGGRAQELRLHTTTRVGADSARAGDRTITLAGLERGIAPEASLRIDRTR